MHVFSSNFLSEKVLLLFAKLKRTTLRDVVEVIQRKNSSIGGAAHDRHSGESVCKVCVCKKISIAVTLAMQ